MAINTNNNILNSRFGVDMTIVKTCVYRKHWSWIDPNNGELHEGEKYLTLIGCVPTCEFTSEVKTFGKDNRPNTNGVYVVTIGSTEGLIVTNNRVGLRTYQDHLEALGWRFVKTVPHAKSKTYEQVRSEAWSIIKFDQSGLKQKLLETIDNITQMVDGDKEVLEELEVLNSLIEAL